MIPHLSLSNVTLSLKWVIRSSNIIILASETSTSWSKFQGCLGYIERWRISPSITDHHLWTMLEDGIVSRKEIKYRWMYFYTSLTNMTSSWMMSSTGRNIGKWGEFQGILCEWRQDVLVSLSARSKETILLPLLVLGVREDCSRCD